MGIYAREKNLVLGFDPGRDKTGFAFVKFSGELFLSGIFATSEREKFFSELLSGSDLRAWVLEGKPEQNIFSHVKFLAIGDGTTSENFSLALREKFSLEILTVDEKNSTLEARKLYWEIHEPNFFQRLLPKTLRVPPRILDDLAAWTIATRAVKKYRDIIKNKL